MNEKLPEKVDLREAVDNYFRYYADFRGRSSRSEWGYIWLFTLVIFIFAIGMAGFLPDLAGVLLGLYGLATIVPSLALTVRRLRDAGHSPYWIFITFVPFIGAVWLIVLCLYDSAYPEGFRLYQTEDVSQRQKVDDVATEIQKLQDLHDRGLIDDEQLKAAKNKALGI